MAGGAALLRKRGGITQSVGSQGKLLFGAKKKKKGVLIVT